MKQRSDDDDDMEAVSWVPSEAMARAGQLRSSNIACSKP